MNNRSRTMTVAASTAAAAVLCTTGSVFGQSQNVSGLIDNHVPPTVTHKTVADYQELMDRAMMNLEIARIRQQQMENNGTTRQSRRGAETSALRGEEALPGDMCANAIAVGELPFVLSGATNGYTDDYGPACTTHTHADGPDIVFSYTAGENDNFMSVNLCTLQITDFDTKVAIYQDSACVLGTEIACADNSCISQGFSATFAGVSRIDDVPIVPGTTYYIVIDGHFTNSFGAFAGTVAATAEPPPSPACPAASEEGGVGRPSVYNEPAIDGLNATFTLSEESLGFTQISRLDLSQGLAIEGLRFWGAEMQYTAVGGPDIANPCPPDENRTFDITFYDDFGGLPGNVICEYANVSATAVHTGVFPFRDGLNELIQYDLALGEGCNTSGGWVAIEGNAAAPADIEDSVCAWLWSNAGIVLGTGSLSLSFGVVSPQADVRALCANGTTLSPGELTGACCAQTFVDIGIESGCLIGSGVDCVEEDGEFFPGLECGDVICFLPRGSCCVEGEPDPDQRCLGLMTADDCAAVEGTTWHEGDSCFQCPAPPPVNDNCVDAIELFPNQLLVTSNVGATLEEGEVNANCSGASAPTDNSVWFRYVSPVGGGSLVLSLCGSPMDSVLSVYDGCPGEGGARAMEIACNDDASCGTASEIIFPWLVEGEEIFIRVGGWNNTQAPFVINPIYTAESACCTASGCEMLSQDDCLALGPAAFFKAGLTCGDNPNCNDNCGRAMTVEGDFLSGVTIEGINDQNVLVDDFAWTSPCAASISFGTGGFQGLWYTFEAPCDGLLDINTAGDDTELLVYQNVCPATPEPGMAAEAPIAAGCDEGALLAAQITDLPVTEGSTYFVRIAHWWQGGSLNASMTFTLHDDVGCDVQCDGDGNGDLIVNVGDLLVVINNWGNTSGARGELEGDLNDDGIVNVSDLLLVINNWGASCG